MEQTTLTEEQKKEYLTRGGVGCPYCGSMNYEGGEIDTGNGYAYQLIYCEDCDNAWTDEYKLIGIEALE